VSKVAIMHRDDSNIILGPRNEWKKGEGFFEPFMHFCKQAKDLRINLSFPVGGLHEDWGGFVEAPGEPDYFCSIDPTGNKKRAVGNYVIGFHHGYYGEFGDLPERMMNYIKENSITILGPVYTMYLHDEICIKDPSQYLAQISVAVSE